TLSNTRCSASPTVPRDLAMPETNSQARLGGRSGDAACPGSVDSYNPEGRYAAPEPPSSSGLGHRPFTPAARVRIPLGVYRGSRLGGNRLNPWVTRVMQDGRAQMVPPPVPPRSEVPLARENGSRSGGSYLVPRRHGAVLGQGGPRGWLRVRYARRPGVPDRG